MSLSKQDRDNPSLAPTKATSPFNKAMAVGYFMCARSCSVHPGASALAQESHRKGALRPHFLRLINMKRWHVVLP